MRLHCMLDTQAPIVTHTHTAASAKPHPRSLPHPPHLFSIRRSLVNVTVSSAGDQDPFLGTQPSQCFVDSAPGGVVVCGSRKGPVVTPRCDSGGTGTPCVVDMQLTEVSQEGSGGCMLPSGDLSSSAPWRRVPTGVALDLPVAADGLYQLRLKSSDAAGNDGDPVSLAFWVHTMEPPSPAITAAPPPVTLTTANTLVVAMTSTTSPGRNYLYAHVGLPTETLQAALAASRPLATQPVPNTAPVQDVVTVPLDQLVRACMGVLVGVYVCVCVHQ
jgi:hypothetical protein